jgi:tetratricopeptide (TPR) repeat protein
MGMFGGDNELGNMLQEAVKLKSAQMGQKRRTYETWPFYVQHTIFHGEKENFAAWRQLPFDEKMVHSDEMKEEGNKLFQAKDWSGAIDKYEEAATLVHYCYSSDPGWRKNNRGIDDDVITLVDDQGSTDEDAKQQIKLRLTCALNIAACKLHLQKYDEVIAACTAALELDKNSVKALYRRAEARIRPNSSTAYDHDCAIKDLAQAAKIEPKNATVTRLLDRLRAERKEQRLKDSETFEGLFDRGEVYDGQGDNAGTASGRPQSTDGNVINSAGDFDMPSIQTRIEAMTDDDPIEKRCADAELLRDLYMRNGKEEEAKELNEKIKQAKLAMKRKEEEKNEPPPSVDWERPTPEMIADAKKYDLDLEDPAVKAELKRMEAEGLMGKSQEELTASMNASAAKSAQAELQPPTGENEIPVPWARYLRLLLCMFTGFKLMDSGLLGKIAAPLYARFFGRTVRAVMGRHTPVEESEVDDERGSLFASAYRQIVTFFGSDEEGEL